MALFAVAVWLLMRSPFGRILKAIREDEDAVRSLGKNVFSYKMQALIIGGVIATFSGMLLALDRGSVQPDNFSRDLTFYILTALVLGGVAKVSGLDRRPDVVLGPRSRSSRPSSPRRPGRRASWRSSASRSSRTSRRSGRSSSCSSDSG